MPPKGGWSSERDAQLFSAIIEVMGLTVAKKDWEKINAIMGLEPQSQACIHRLRAIKLQGGGAKSGENAENDGDETNKNGEEGKAGKAASKKRSRKPKPVKNGAHNDDDDKDDEEEHASDGKKPKHGGKKRVKTEDIVKPELTEEDTDEALYT